MRFLYRALLTVLLLAGAFPCRADVLVSNPQIFTETVNNTVDLVATNQYTTTPGTEAIVVVAMAMESGGALVSAGNLGLVSTVSFHGDPAALGTRFGGAGTGANDRMSEIWVLMAPDIGAFPLVVSFDAQTDATAILVFEVRGVEIAMLGGVSTGEGTPSSCPCTMSLGTTTTTNNSLVFVAAVAKRGSTANSNPFTPTSGTELMDGQTGTGANGDLSYWVSVLPSTLPALRTLSATMAAANAWTMVGAELLGSTAPPPVFNPLTLFGVPTQ